MRGSLFGGFPVAGGVVLLYKHVTTCFKVRTEIRSNGKPQLVDEWSPFSARRVHTHPRVFFCVSSVFVLEFSGSLTNVHLCGSLNIPETNSFQSKAAHLMF